MQNAYSFTKRKLVTGDRYVHAAINGLVDKDDYSNDILCEPLIEHVGHLPILTAYLHPHIEHFKKVDLGRVMIMLSVHDIGETVTGDIFAYSKTEQEGADEYEIALRVTDISLHPYLKEYEDNKTFDAKYARAIDSLAPNIHEVDMPKVTLKRFAVLDATVQDIIDKKRHYMEWDIVLLEVFDLLMNQYKAVESGEEPIFETEEYDVV